MALNNRFLVKSHFWKVAILSLNINGLNIWTGGPFPWRYATQVSPHSNQTLNLWRRTTYHKGPINATMTDKFLYYCTIYLNISCKMWVIMTVFYVRGGTWVGFEFGSGLIRTKLTNFSDWIRSIIMKVGGFYEKCANFFMRPRRVFQFDCLPGSCQRR